MLLHVVSPVSVVVASFMTNLQVRANVGTTVDHTIQVMNVNRLAVEQVLTTSPALPVLTAAVPEFGAVGVVADLAFLLVPHIPVGMQCGIILGRSRPHDDVRDNGSLGDVDLSDRRVFAAP